MRAVPYRRVAKQTDLRKKLSRYHADVDSAFYGWNDIWLNSQFKGWNIVGELATIECPVLAVQAEDDHYGTMAQIEAIAQAVQGAQLFKLPRGHSPHREVAETLNEVIASFVA